MKADLLISSVLSAGLVAGLGLLAQRRWSRRRCARADHDGFLNDWIEEEEAVRQRMSQALHDGLCQRLSLVRDTVAQALSQPGGDPALRAPLTEVSQWAAQSLEQALCVARHLHPLQPDGQGLKPAIEALAAEVSSTDRLRCFLELGEFEAELTPTQKLQVYRLVETGLRPVIDHASLVMIEIKTEPGHLRIQLEDDRLGLDPAATESELIRGAGLEHLHQRAKLAGGALRVSIAPSGGARVRIAIPLGTPEAR